MADRAVVRETGVGSSGVLSLHFGQMAGLFWAVISLRVCFRNFRQGGQVVGVICNRTQKTQLIKK